MGLHVVGGKEWDERRNTSRVFPVAPEALGNAQRALASFRRDYPALHSWIAEGAPNLTEADHLVRFGVPYQKASRRGSGGS